MNFQNGTVIGDLTILKYNGNSTYSCKCKCGIRKRVHTKDINTYVCTHTVPNRDDISNLTFGEWKVLKPTSKGYYLCKCSCGKEQEVYITTLKSGKSTSCGHSTTGFIDLKNKQFGYWKVLEYEGNHFWKCKCICGNIKNIHRYTLLNGLSTSCGCKASEAAQLKMITSGKVKNKTQEQLDILLNKDKMKQFIENIRHKPTIYELSQLLNSNRSSIGVYIRKYNLQDYIDISPKQSQVEKDIIEYIRNIADSKYEIQTNVRGLLDNNKELDIYIPEKKIAIEVNGSYWHSEIYKDNKYHQQKSLEALNKGIRLIHIFDYEWNNKFKQYLSNLFSNKIKLRAHKCEIREINKIDAHNFCKKYHLQGYAESLINLGLFNKNSLVAVMTFGIPRFNSNFDYELLRLVYKSGIIIHGGASKLLKYFIEKYKPSNIISYCDISKFEGKVYENIGFTRKPNYVWVDSKLNIVTRYQSQKKNLLKYGLGTVDESESNIMRNLGYYKVYNSGNMRFELDIERKK